MLKYSQSTKYECGFKNDKMRIFFCIVGFLFSHKKKYLLNLVHEIPKTPG